MFLCTKIRNGPYLTVLSIYEGCLTMPRLSFLQSWWVSVAVQLWRYPLIFPGPICISLADPRNQELLLLETAQYWCYRELSKAMVCDLTRGSVWVFRRSLRAVAIVPKTSEVSLESPTVAPFRIFMLQAVSNSISRFPRLFSTSSQLHQLVPAEELHELNLPELMLS